MKRSLFVLLAVFIVGWAFGQSPAKIRITTWNLEWFPNGYPHDATPEKQAQRIEAAADVLETDRDILLLQEMRGYDALRGSPRLVRSWIATSQDETKLRARLAQKISIKYST